KIVNRGQITTLMVTHNMRDAIRFGNRLVMFHEGRVVIDVEGAEKKELTVEKLLRMFDRVSGSDSLDGQLLLS
ncbi:MAG TPA: ABC transporter ATP-binding protein, partial [Clostridiaceae bacterium]|nr:ABC transporter ATP-binding protein [Clostridiaceae bacterium]